MIFFSSITIKSLFPFAFAGQIHSRGNMQNLHLELLNPGKFSMGKYVKGGFYWGSEFLN